MFHIFEEFREAAKQICDDLSIKFNLVRFTKYETPKVGLDYIADGKSNSTSFSFHLKTQTKEEDFTSGKMTASLEIVYSKSASSFYFPEDIDYLRGHPNFLGRWAAWAVFNYNIKHNPVNLDSLFNEADIKVYGIPNYPTPTITELKIFFKGIIKTSRKITVYIFRHPDENYRYRAFSYAFYVPTNPHLWIFFPQLGGLDSGGAHRCFQIVEKLLRIKKIKIERRRFDISYKDLAEYLEEHALRTLGRHTIEEENLKFIGLDKPHSVLGKDYANLKEKFFNLYKQDEYPQALRNLRALVQEALERTCKHYQIEIGDTKERNIGKLSEKLIKRQIIDGTLREWFSSFTSVANLASHREFPTVEDLREYNMLSRIELTFSTGIYLIVELETAFSKKPRSKAKL